ncbi:MAG: hypothetical protein AB7P76_11870 [Candidatus Melainabacteria bacterium]
MLPTHLPQVPVINRLKEDTHAPVIESIRLHLVDGFKAFNKGQESVSLSELIEYLVDSLEEADKATADKAESLLVRIGMPAVPFLLKGLKSSNGRVKATCAMALIRIGEPVLPELNVFYARHANRSKLSWALAFIYEQLAEPLPLVEDEMIETSKVVALAQAV